MPQSGIDRLTGSPSKRKLTQIKVQNYVREAYMEDNHADDAWGPGR